MVFAPPVSFPEVVFPLVPTLLRLETPCPFLEDALALEFLRRGFRPFDKEEAVEALRSIVVIKLANVGGGGGAGRLNWPFERVVEVPLPMFWIGFTTGTPLVVKGEEEELLIRLIANLT